MSPPHSAPSSPNPPSGPLSGPSSGHGTGGRLVFLFSLTTGLAAGLVFWLQPFVGKLLLPAVGGAPAVWNAVMLFFQAALLGGYTYAHLTSRWLSPKAQGWLHLALMGGCLAWLPIGLPAAALDVPPGGENPTAWLLMTLTSGVAAPFIVLAGSAPILQRWFAATDHVDAANPYFLYAASNVGSMVALVGFPLVFEPLLDLNGQGLSWSGAFVVLVGLSALCIWSIKPTRGEAKHNLSSAGVELEAGPRPTWPRRVHWAVITLVTTSLMLGLTTHLTTDVAAVPLLWVVPLALYLLTFVLAFARHTRVTPKGSTTALLVVVIGYAGVLAVNKLVPGAVPWFALAFFLCLLFFTAALACHAALVARRPDGRYLTEFYLWIAIGGVLGGGFNALVAPQVFNSVVEFPLMMAASILLVLLGTVRVPTPSARPRAWAITAIAGAAMTLGMVMVVKNTDDDGTNRLVLRERNFFGVLTLIDRPDTEVRVMRYGTTVHGTQALDPAHHAVPLSYYGLTSPIGDVFAEMRGRTKKADVGVIGLGTGAIACHLPASSGRLTFFEINPAVTRIAENPNLFSYLSVCGASYRVKHGDGRLALGTESNGAFDLIYVDAFTSDSIPVHLLTRDAVRVYLDKLAPNGLIAMHVSNRNLVLAPVVAAIARDLDLHVIRRMSEATPAVPGTKLTSYAAEVVVLARHAGDFGPLAGKPGWQTITAEAGTRAWDDGFSNIVGALRILNQKGPPLDSAQKQAR